MPFRRLAAVDGRSDDILRFPGPSGGDIAVHPYRLRAPLAAFGELRQYQIVQHHGGLQIRIVATPSAPRDLPARVHDAVIDALEAAGVLPPRLEVVPVDADRARERPRREAQAREAARLAGAHAYAHVERHVTGLPSIACSECAMFGGTKTMSPGRARRPLPVPVIATDSVPDRT